MSEKKRVPDSAEKILKILQKKPTTTEQLASKLDINERTVKANIQKLKEKGNHIINRDGRYSLPVSIDDILETFTKEDLPVSTYSKPYKAKTKRPDEFKFAFSNTIYAGGKNNQTLVKNLLKYCEASDVDGMILTGNTLWMDLTRFSKYKPDRAQSAEYIPNPEEIGYSEYTRNLGEGPEDIMSSDERDRPVFITFKEKFDSLINHSLTKLFLDDNNGNPIYNGPVYVIFGQTEEELARQHANDLVRRETFKAKKALQERINDQKEDIRAYEKEQRDLEREADKIRTRKEILKRRQKRLEKYILSVQEKLNVETGTPKKKKASQTKKTLNLKQRLKEYKTEKTETARELSQMIPKGRKIESRLENIEPSIIEAYNNINCLNDDLARVTMTNADEQFVKRAFLMMKAYIKNRIEEAIPNCTVISTGDGFIEAGGEIIKAAYSADKVGERVSDNLMDRLVEKTRENLPLGERPYISVAGGLSSTYTHVPVAYVEEDGSDRTITLLQLATCLDDKSLEDMLSDKVKAAGNNMTKLSTKKDFSTAAVIVEKLCGIQRREALPSQFLTNEGLFENPEKAAKTPMIYGANFSDQHHGSKYSTVVETEDDIRYAFVVAQELLREMGAPIVRVTSLGDELQGENYKTAAEKHKHDFKPKQLEKLLDEAIANEKDPEKKAKKLKKLAMLKAIRSGISMPQDQKDDFLEHIDYELLKQVMENHKEAKMTGPMYQIIEGNHTEHTYEGLTIISKEIAQEIAHRLNINPEDACAPTFSNMGLHTGQFGVEDHYQYGEYCRHKQGGAKNSKDPTRQTRVKFTTRGQDFKDLIGKFTINRTGHTHMGGQTLSRNVFHDIGYCTMDRNEYGEKFDFGSPARGFKVEGLPVDGWENGPIVTIEFPIEYITKWAREKPEIDTDRLYKNSIIKPKKK